MICIIAEKLSVAREIADIVKADNKQNGYFEGYGYSVNWAFEQLILLAYPEDYGIQSFQKEHLPIIPKILYI